MFVEAIERVSEFTRPIHILSRLYHQAEILPGAATLFLLTSRVMQSPADTSLRLSSIQVLFSKIIFNLWPNTAGI